MKLALLPTSAAFLFLCASACATEEGNSDCERKLATNKIATNKIATNKIATNKIATNGLLNATLPEVPLTSGSITDNVPAVALQDAFVQDVLEYMVECALAPEQSIEIGTGDDRRVYAGALGLAPAWGDDDGACDADCQGWVSACLIARTNFEGVSRPISLLGDRPELEPTAQESADFAIEEATYFGDLFGDDRAMYACLPAGGDVPERTCDGDAGGCAIVIVGGCDEHCDASGCRDPHGVAHPQTITVNLPDDAASCG